MCKCVKSSSDLVEVSGCFRQVDALEVQCNALLI